MTHNANYSDNWEWADWKNFRKFYSASKEEYFKQSEKETRLKPKVYRNWFYHLV